MAIQRKKPITKQKNSPRNQTSQEKGHSQNPTGETKTKKMLPEPGWSQIGSR